MKMISCLFLLVSFTISTGQQNTGNESKSTPSTLELLEEVADNTIQKLKSAIRDSVLSEDGLSLSKNMTISLEALKALCDPTETDLVGKTCRKEVSKLGKCSGTPCRIFDWAKNRAPAALNRFLAADTYEEIYRVIFGEWIVPVWRELCECPGVVNASINCVRKYDGVLLYVLKEVERERFDVMVQKMDWEALNLVIHGVLSTLCKVNGSDCLDKMTEQLASGNGRVLDNTFKGEDGCLSLKRVEEEITGVLMSQVHETAAENITAYIEECLKLWDALMCDDKCSSEMQGTFYSSCCIKRAAKRSNSPEMRRNVGRLMRNVWGMVYEGAMPEGIVDQYLSMFEPPTFCGNKTSVYRDFDKTCPATPISA